MTTTPGSSAQRRSWSCSTSSIKLTDEEQRGISENLSDEELAVFDLLLKPAVELTKDERESVKEVAQGLLQTLRREKLILDWRKQQQSRAAVRLTIEKMLDPGGHNCYARTGHKEAA